MERDTILKRTVHYLLWFMPRVEKLKMFNSLKNNQILLKKIDFQSVKVSVSDVVRELRKAGNDS